MTGTGNIALRSNTNENRTLCHTTERHQVAPALCAPTARRVKQKIVQKKAKVRKGLVINDLRGRAPPGVKHFLKKSLPKTNFVVVFSVVLWYYVHMKDKKSQSVKADPFMEKVMRLNKIAAENAKKNLASDPYRH